MKSYVEKKLRNGSWVKAALHRMGAAADDAALDFMFDKLDTAGSGRLPFERFLEYSTYISS